MNVVRGDALAASTALARTGFVHSAILGQTLSSACDCTEHKN